MLTAKLPFFLLKFIPEFASKPCTFHFSLLLLTLTVFLSLIPRFATISASKVSTLLITPKVTFLYAISFCSYNLSIILSSFWIFFKISAESYCVQ